ncbi:TIGR02270 family protein [Aquabacterium sp.]|uniref:TIGR02270 family protein n=1 Tax=Aquabacterium sp. TaxID=1872578 RepID=UPI004037FA85
MNTINRPAVRGVIEQHAQEVALLRNVRGVLCRAPHVQLHRLHRLDDRIAAHMDGLLQAGAAGRAMLVSALEAPDAGTVFAVAVAALQSRDAELLTHVVKVAASLPEAQRGLLSALGWVSASDLQGTVRALLGSKVPRHRAWALTACAMHRVDPGAVLAQAVQDADAQVRACAWRVAGRLGRLDLADAARQVLSPSSSPTQDEHATVVIQPAQAQALAEVWSDRRAAAWALTLWGMGQNELVRQALLSLPEGQPYPPQDAHRLAVMATPLDWGRDQVRALTTQAEAKPLAKRRMMRMAAWVGDVQVVPWLIHHMADDRWARLAGEAFSLITGADLAALALERVQDEVPEAPFKDDPQDSDVSLDEDDSLPWPDQHRVQAWWQSQAPRFVAGQRYFVGASPSLTQASQVLRTAGQRQRIMAAEYLSLLQPGVGLFPVAAPAWRQSRWLTQEGASAS